MTSTESNERTTEQPKNAIWLQTYYYTIPYNVLNMEFGQAVQTPLMKFPWVEDQFTFQFARLNEITYGAYAVRFPTNPSAEGDNGCILQFQFTMVGSKEDMKTAYLYPEDKYTNVFFSNESFLEPYLMYNYDQYYFDLKVIVNLWEYENLSNEVRQQQEDGLSKMKKKAIESEEQLQRLCEILKIPALEDIFTGRQDLNFAQRKTALFFKTSKFTRVIEHYFKEKKKGPLPPSADEKIGMMVNYMFTEEKGAITDKVIHLAYVTAYELGVEYLKELTRDMAMRRLKRGNLMIYMATAADKFGDKVLFDKIAPAIRFFLPKIMITRFWAGLVKETPYMIRSIVHSMKIRESTYELHVALPNSARHQTTEL